MHSIQTRLTDRADSGTVPELRLSLFPKKSHKRQANYFLSDFCYPVSTRIKLNNGTLTISKFVQ